MTTIIIRITTPDSIVLPSVKPMETRGYTASSNNVDTWAQTERTTQLFKPQKEKLLENY